MREDKNSLCPFTVKTGKRNAAREIQIPQDISFPLTAAGWVVTTKSSTSGKRCCGESHVEIACKMDGENTTLCADGSGHDRSMDSKKHSSREELTSLWNSK